MRDAKGYPVDMKRALRARLAVLVLGTGAVLSGGHAQGSDATPAVQPSPAPSPPAARLKLGPYVDPYGPAATERLFDVPHFETRVEVQGKAMDSAALTARMEWWMRDFEPLRGAVSHAGSAPSVQDMAPYRHHVDPALNFAPLIGWLVDKLNGKKEP